MTTYVLSFKIQFKMFYKDRTEYKNFFVELDMDICKGFDNKLPPFQQLFFNLGAAVVSRVYPQYVHKCPYYVSKIP